MEKLVDRFGVVSVGQKTVKSFLFAKAVQTSMKVHEQNLLGQKLVRPKGNHSSLENMIEQQLLVVAVSEVAACDVSKK